MSTGLVSKLPLDPPPSSELSLGTNAMPVVSGTSVQIVAPNYFGREIEGTRLQSLRELLMIPLYYNQRNSDSPNKMNADYCRYRAKV